VRDRGACRTEAWLPGLRGFLRRSYRPDGVRLGILTDHGVDPRVLDVLEECLAAHDMLPARRLARLRPRPQEHCLRSEDLVDFLTRYGHEYQVVLLRAAAGIGDGLDIAAVTAAGNAAGCAVGWDLTAVAGATPERLASWKVGFAIRPAMSAPDHMFETYSPYDLD
jgi:kynureninase